MPTIEYLPYNPNSTSRKLIERSVEILEDYESQGYTLTLRQLYYQLVSKDLIPNSERSYKNLGSIISRAREAGMIDWSHIEDRTRTVQELPHWDDAEDFMASVVPQYRHDLWEGQQYRVFIFVEKEALEQVVGRSAERYDCPYFANKGYLSSSAAWNVAHNMMRRHAECDSFIVLHLGDHDPSGIDMTRDIEKRLDLFSGSGDHCDIEVRRIALNMDQIDRYSPPPNPAKTTDSRFADYRRLYGDKSWELDALEPSVIDKLISDNILEYLDYDMWQDRLNSQNRIRKDLIESVKNL